MTKFGEIINTRIPVLISFYADWEESYQDMYDVIRNVAAALGDRAKVVRIDIDKNRELSAALRISNIPTLILYKNGQMVWRESGEFDTNSIIINVENYIK